MTHEECWLNSLNRYLAIMDTRTDHIPAITDEMIRPVDPECRKRGEQMDNNEVLVITPEFPMGERDMNCARILIKQQKEEGVVLLPFGYKVLVKPKDVEIKLGPDKDEENVIRNATTYICLAEKNKRGGEAFQIAKVLYDRAYRKGFEAGKLEGKKEGRVKVKTVHEPADPDEKLPGYYGDFLG